MIRAAWRRYTEVLHSFRCLKCRLMGVTLEKPCRICSGAILRCGVYQGKKGSIRIAQSSEIADGALLDAWGGSITIDQNTYIGPYSVIYGHGGVVIGKSSLISPHVCILSANHSIAPQSELLRSQPDVRQPTTIGSDVWLGAGAKIMAGVTVGDGAVIGAGAVVTKDIAPYSIALGVPAQVVGERPQSTGSLAAS